MKAKDLPLPDAWPKHIHQAFRCIAGMAHFTIIQTRSWCANSQYARVRLAGKAERAEAALSVEREINRIKNQRMARIPAHKRPYYSPVERLHILEMRASQGWSGVETARVFQVTPDTIRSWEKEATNPDTKLLERSQPVNTYADFVRLVVCRLKVLCPALGKKKIAQFLARAGLHLAVSTVGRMTSSPPRSPRSVSASAEQSTIVRADRPGKVWHVDLTIVPTSRFYVPWMPHALPQCWPFCWWLAAVIDHYSRACIGFTVFLKEPTARQVLDFLDSVVKQRGKPRYIISDKGPQFDCDQYKGWCKRRHVRPRFGAIGKHGSIAVIERFFRSFKGECMRRILVPYNLDDVRHEIELYVTWYNNLRPHETLDGATPFEIHEGIQPANQLRRLEPRQHWPRGSPCAAPAVDIEGDPGIRFELHLEFVEGRKHLPIIELRKVA